MNGEFCCGFCVGFCVLLGLVLMISLIHGDTEIAVDQYEHVGSMATQCEDIRDCVAECMQDGITNCEYTMIRKLYRKQTIRDTQAELTEVCQ